MPQKLTKLKIDEVSLVDKGANQHADVMIFKREEPVGKISFQDALGDMALDDATYSALGDLYRRFEALQRSIASIRDEPEDYPDQEQAIRDSMTEFASSIGDLVDNFSVEKQEEDEEEERRRRRRRRRDPNYRKSANVKKGFNMAQHNDAVSKAVEDAMLALDLPEGVDVDAIAKSLTDEITKSVDSEPVVITQDQADFMKSLDASAKEDFLAKSDEDRNAMIEKAKADDEVLKTDAGEIRKSEVGAGVFAILKSQQVAIDKANEETRKNAEALEQEKLAKRAETELANLPGDPVQKGQILKTLEGMPAEQRDLVMKALKSADENVGKSFHEIGTQSNPGDTDSGERLDTMAKAYAQEKGVSIAKAYTAVLQTPEGAELYENSR